MDPVVHFEMPYEDRDRAARFYESAFGWQMQKLGAEMGNYLLATTTETDEAGPRNPGTINGGLFAREPGSPMQYPSLVIAVEDIGKAVERVKGAGGRVLAGPMEIPGVGQYVAFADPEGNGVGMLQPVPRNWHVPEGA